MTQKAVTKIAKREKRQPVTVAVIDGIMVTTPASTTQAFKSEEK